MIRCLLYKIPKQIGRIKIMSEVRYLFKGNPCTSESLSDSEACDLAYRLECQRDAGLPVADVVVNHCDAYGLPCSSSQHDAELSIYGMCVSCGDVEVVAA